MMTRNRRAAIAVVLSTALLLISVVMWVSRDLYSGPVPPPPRRQRVGNQGDTLVVSVMEIDGITIDSLIRATSGWDVVSSVVVLTDSTDDVAIGTATSRGKLYIYEPTAAAKVYIESNGLNSELIIDSDTDDDGVVRFYEGGVARSTIRHDGGTDTLFITSSGQIVLNPGLKVVIEDTAKIRLGIKFPDGTFMTSAGSSIGGGWTDDGAVVRLSTLTDAVSIGTTGDRGHLYIYDASNAAQQYIESDGDDAELIIDSDTDYDSALRLYEAGVSKASFRHDGDTERLLINTTDDIEISAGDKITLGDTTYIDVGLVYSGGSKQYYAYPDIFWNIERPDTFQTDTFTIAQNFSDWTMNIDSVCYKAYIDNFDVEIIKRPIAGGASTIVDTSLVRDNGQDCFTRAKGSVANSTLAPGWEWCLVESDSAGSSIVGRIKWVY